MKNLRKRLPALLMAGIMTVGAVAPAASAAAIPAAVDETYYATLDYYGAVTDASVVKSYRLNGERSITDYGSYDEIVNLTDSLAPSVDGGAVTFTFGEDAPEKFYFEGKTQKPFEELPWNIAVSYKLNGAPALAEDLAGKTGLVEIFLDVTRNPAAPAYSKDNLVLTAAAMFNDDDVTSLEAAGAEVQMIGNLRAVLFMVLPGEEQHFVIRVGSDDFSFSGLILLAVPATLQQLEQVKDLREAKEKGEDSLDAIGDSMDAIMDAMEGMSGSLNAAASGLDQLNSARATLQNSKGEVYDKTDLALSDLDALANTLGSLDKYSATASQAITDLNGNLNDLNASAQALKPELESTRKAITAIQADTKALRELLSDVEGYNKRATDVSSSLADQLKDMNTNMDDLQLDLYRLRNALEGTKGVSTLSTSDILSLLSPEEASQMRQVLRYRQQYETAMGDPASAGIPADEARDMTFEEFLILGAFKPKYEQQAEAAVTAQVTAAYEQYAAQVIAAGGTPMTAQEFMAQEAIQAQIAAGKAQAEANFWPAYHAFLADESDAALSQKATAKAASDAYEDFVDKQPMLNTLNKKIKEINDVVTGITKPTAVVVEDLAELLDEVGDSGVTGDLGSLAELCRDLLKTMKEHEGEGASLLEHIDDLGDLAGRVTKNCDDLLEKVDALNDTLNAYEPELQSAVTDIQALSGSAQSTLHDLSAMISSMENLLKTVSPQLDAGTRDTLNGVSASLRKATRGLDEMDTIRSAKDTIKDLIDDEWDDHTGQVDGLLNIDAGATPVSMTDERNPAPGSIQYVMRTQEIKVDDAAEETISQTQKEETTFWGRVAAMFQGLWESFKRLLHIG